MNKLFNLDNPVMVQLARATDMVLLSFLWFVCCLPVITIIPSTAAMYYVTLKMVRKEEDVRIGKSFFHAFKSNFKQGVVLSLIFIVVGIVIFLDYFIMSGVEGTAGTICTACFFVMGIWELCIMFYTCPLQAQFKNPILQTLKNAAILSMQKVINTVLVFILNMLPFLIAIISFKLFVITLPLWVLCAPAPIAYVCSSRFVKIVDPLIKAAENETP